MKVAYKGFNQGLKCRDFQYEIGKSYVESRKLAMFQTGFHACYNPMDVFRYVSIYEGNRFAEVLCENQIIDGSEPSNGGKPFTKLTCSKITIKEELPVSAFIEKSTQSHQEHVAAYGDKVTPANSGGDNISASAFGDYSIAGVTSNYGSAAIAFGKGSKSIINGKNSTAFSVGTACRAWSLGNRCASVAAGMNADAISGGREAAAIATVEMSTALSHGARSSSLSTASFCRSITHGDWSVSVTTGSSSSANATGTGSIAVSLGNTSVSKAACGGAIVCTYYNGYGELVHIKSSLVGQNGIEPNQYYTLDENGNFVKYEGTYYD